MPEAFPNPGAYSEVSMTSRFFFFSVACAALYAATAFASDQGAKPTVLAHKQHKKSRKQKQPAAVSAPASPQRAPAAAVHPLAQTPAVHPDGVVNSSWNGGTGNWNVNGDWTPGTGFPNNGGGSTYDVTIGTGSDNVSLNTNVTISSLTLGTSSGTSILQNLSGSAETLTDLGALTVNSGGQLIFEKGSTLTVGAGGSNAGLMDLDQGSTASITGSFTNSGTIETNRFNLLTNPNNFTVTGTLTNSGLINLGNNNNTADVMNLGGLTNTGEVIVGDGATLKLTSQPNGITDAVAGSQLYVGGTFKAGTASGLANLGSVEGTVALENGQTTSITPGSGTLTISGSGIFDLDASSKVTITGAVNNSALIETNRYNDVGSNTLTVSGALTNSGEVLVGNNNNTTDVMNVGSLTNTGDVIIGGGATLNLTSQPNGITDAVAGTQLYIGGSVKAGTASGVAKLGSVEGLVTLENGQTTTITPGSGTLTISGTGIFDVDASSSVTISGAV